MNDGRAYNQKDINRFWSKVDKSTDEDQCWLFKTSSIRGYGRITMGGKVEQAYRVSYRLAHGDLPDELNVYRSCETLNCVNPKHLALELPHEERFWSKVSIGAINECWEWLAGRNDDGYGAMRWVTQRMEKAHRIAWMLAHGEIPEHLEVCHTCDNPPCCNPSHLFLGTHTENIHDMIAKGRLVNPRGEQHGASKFTNDQITEMRQLHQNGEAPQSIAKLYGVSQNYIYDILNHQSRT